MNTEYLLLKWGTLKDWRFSENNKRAKELLKEYFDIGSCQSVALQEDNERQKEIICELIDIGDFEKVESDFDGKMMTKEKAKVYVLDYGKGK